MEFLARMSGLLVTQAGDETAAAGAAAASATEIQSVLDFVMKGGVMMVPIGVCSLIALTVFADVQNVYNRSNPAGLMYSYDFSEEAYFYDLPIFPNVGLKLEY